MSKSNPNRYTIHDATEETFCDYCGCPLYVGDRAYPSRDESAVYCCDAERRASEEVAA